MPTRQGDITLELDTIRLRVNPHIGCSIVSLEIRDQRRRWAPVLRTMGQDSSDPSDAACFVMAPWTNRVKDARYRFGGTEHTLIPNNRDATAIHGLARDLPWAITDRSPITARFVLDTRKIDPEPAGLPYHFGAIQRFEIGPASLDIDLSVTNLDQRPVPAGCGLHPYIHRHLFSNTDELRVQLDVAGRYPADNCIPTGDPVDDDVCRALRAGGPIGNPGLDDVFAGFGGQAVFDWPASNTRMTMRCDERLGHVVIYTPRISDGSPGEFVCVEPVTMVNDGFNRLDAGHTDTGVVVLDPGQTLRTRTTLSFTQAN